MTLSPIDHHQRVRMRNLNVIACNETDGFYYPGFVSRLEAEEETVLVRFYDIKPAKVVREDVIYTGGAIPCPDLQVGDYALARVLCRTTRAEYYVPGVVIVLPRGHAHETRFYTLQIYNGRFVEKMRRNIVKIGPEKFRVIFKYIAELRYGRLRRSVTMESLCSDRDPRPQLRRKWNSSSQLRLYPDKTEKINVYRLHDRSKEKYSEPKPKQIRKHHKNSHQSSRSENEHPSELSEPKNRKTKTTSQSYPKPWKSEEKIIVRSTTTSYSNDTFTGTEQARKEEKDVLGHSCDSLRSVESLKSDSTTGGRKEEKEKKTKLHSSRHRNSSTSESKGEATKSVKIHSSRHQNSSTSASKNEATKSGKDRKRESKSRREKRKRKISVDSLVTRSSTSSLSSRTSSIVSSVVPKRTLRPSLEVLARWSDDGWYYRGVVVKEGGDDRYIVRDVTGYSESILLEDILLDSDNKFQVVQPFDHVIALHPSYVFSYAPAVVKEAYPNGVTVVFYDKTQHKLQLSELYRINRSKYRKVVEYIRNCENSSAKCVAIARNDNTGVYNKCEIVCCEGVGGQNYIVKWPCGELGQQVRNQIFLVNTGNQAQRKINWKYALAPSDETLSEYLPAEVIQTEPFRVKIFNQSRLTECCSHQCYWLNEAYYNNAVNFYNNIASNQHE